MSLFVDYDVEVTADELRRLSRHFDDPCVALVGPRVVSVARSVRPRWHERYDENASSFDLGGRACSVRPGAAVGWLPSACVVGRVDLLAGGFDDALRIGEDVDLVWRLVAAGHTVRYDPTVVARHDTRPTLAGWLGRKFAYGTGGAVLAQRHGDHTAVARLSPAMALPAAALLLRRPWSVPMAAACLARSASSLAGSFPEPVVTPQLAARLSACGLGWSLRQESALLLRHWWPAVVIGLIASRSVRRAVVTACVVDVVSAAFERARDRPVDASSSWASHRCRQEAETPEVLRYLLDPGIGLPKDTDHVLAELLGIRLEHDLHPASSDLRRHRSDVTCPCSSPNCRG